MRFCRSGLYGRRAGGDVDARVRGEYYLQISTRGLHGTMFQTVAVLMTDLVGSTETAARLGPAAAEELRLEHFRLLRGAMQRTGGSEVKSLGDGVMAVFPSASAALSCAAG